MEEWEEGKHLTQRFPSKSRNLNWCRRLRRQRRRRRRSDNNGGAQCSAALQLTSMAGEWK